MKTMEKNISDKRLTFNPRKDIPLFSFGILLIVSIFLASYFSVRKSDNVHVEIKYQNQLLFDKNDSERKKEISFPMTGEKKITFMKKEASTYIEGITEFSFEGESVSFTLYSDKSIQIMTEDITCPDHVCSKMGRIHSLYTPIVCMPNGIQIMIVSDYGFPESVN